MTGRNGDIETLARALGLGRLPYRSFNNPLVRRAAKAPDTPPSAAPVAELPRPERPMPAARETPPLLQVVAGRQPQIEEAPPATPAQIIAWPVPDQHASAGPSRAGGALPPTADASPEDRFLLVAAVLALAGRSDRMAEGAPATGPTGFTLLLQAIGPAASPLPPSPTPAAEGRGAGTTGEYPLLDAVLAAER